MSSKKMGCFTTAYAIRPQEASCGDSRMFGPYWACLNCASALEIPRTLSAEFRLLDNSVFRLFKA